MRNTILFIFMVIILASPEADQSQQGFMEPTWNPGKELQDGVYLHTLIVGKRGRDGFFRGKFIKN
jgi:hypothetical protein